ncbi:hypothetical protein E1J22_07245 [Xanthomonas citri]|nr:hypothetical protein [Xanthomonas citri]
MKQMRGYASRHRAQACTPTLSTGPCRLTGAGPYAAWMPRKSLQGRTCSVSCDGGPARALQRTSQTSRSQPIPPLTPITWPLM